MANVEKDENKIAMSLNELKNNNKIKWNDITI